MRALDILGGEESLLAFTRRLWPVLEPHTPFVEGWALGAICEHLEAVTDGEITRLLMNVPPGFSKSLMTNVFWPAWEWGPQRLAHHRFVTFSYAAQLTERDNRRFLDLIKSPDYQWLWGDRFELRKAGETLVSNDKTGWKLASSVGGVATGERGDRILLDDPHSIKESESDVVRSETVRWFREAMSNRLNNMDESAIVVIMQRVHEADVSGAIIESAADYTHLMIPMEYDGRRYTTSIGWTDPREDDGALAWPERFPVSVIADIKAIGGPYAYAGQYQQAPSPRGGGIFRREWWQLWGNENDPSDIRNRTFPACEYIVASLDPAYTEKQENDYSAMTVWGVFRDERQGDMPKIMLLHAWRDRLAIHDLVEKCAEICKRFKADRLLIESKASGISVAQELRRLYAGELFGVQLVDPKGLDKVARAYAVQPLFADEMIYAPFRKYSHGSWGDREWCDMLISEMASFPRAPHDDLCLVGDTIIATRRGKVKIKDVLVGDEALTPDGWRRVLKSGFTGVRPVVERGKLTGTSSHPVFTVDGGYQKLYDITDDATLVRNTICGFLKTALLMSLSSMESNTDAWAESADIIYRSQNPMRVVRPLRDCMLRFGSFIRGGQFRQAVKFTTKTVTLSISSLKIWSAYQKASIGAFRNALIRNSVGCCSIVFDRWLRVGTSRMRVASGIDSTPSNPFKSPASSAFQTASSALGCVNGAERSSSLATCAGNFAALLARYKSQDFCEGSIASSIPTLQPVYNLSVEGAHCYFANGVLVHNCDSATQALSHLRRIGLAIHETEIKRDELEQMMFKPEPKPLYGAI